MGKNKAADSSSEWEEIPEGERTRESGAFWRPEIGDTVEVFLHESRKGKFGEFYVAYNRDGEEVLINMSAGLAELPFERWLRIRYRGKVEDGKITRHKYDVLRGPPVEHGSVPIS